MHGMRSTFIGFALAVLLTAIPFALVATQSLPRQATLLVIAVFAVVQIMAHLRFFLGTRLRSGDQSRTGALLFACVLLFVMVGGTIWVMGNLNWRMM